jgi:hypothetical protein
VIYWGNANATAFRTGGRDEPLNEEP